MSPIQFSTLKALNPLDQKPERGENHDGQADIQKVLHGALLGVALWWSGSRWALTLVSETPGNAGKSGPNGTHARGLAFLTEPMRFAHSPPDMTHPGRQVGLAAGVVCASAQRRT
jgi:hypothetical protein